MALAMSASPLRLVHDARQGQLAELGELGQQSDQQLVSNVLAGERRAFEALYRRHAPFAINLAVRLQGSGRDVEDLVHDAFLKVHDRLSELRDPGVFRGWLGSIVVRLVRTRMRREKLARFLGVSDQRDSGTQLEALAAESASPELRAELAQVYALLGTLSADLRIAWTLRYVEGQRLEAVAQLCNCSLATAKRRLQRAQEYLDRHFVDPRPSEASTNDADAGGRS